jgi:hypothetical protein
MLLEHDFFPTCLRPPKLRASDQPKQKISVAYGPAGDYPDVAEGLRAIGMLEILAEHEAESFTWRRPITFEAHSRGRPDLHWDLSTQRILVCYEMAADFGHLYRDYGLADNAFQAQLPPQKKR